MTSCRYDCIRHRAGAIASTTTSDQRSCRRSRTMTDIIARSVLLSRRGLVAGALSVRAAGQSGAAPRIKLVAGVVWIVLPHYPRLCAGIGRRHGARKSSGVSGTATAGAGKLGSVVIGRLGPNAGPAAARPRIHRRTRTTQRLAATIRSAASAYRSGRCACREACGPSSRDRL